MIIGPNEIMLGKLLWSLEHLKHQNPSIISNSTGIFRLLPKSAKVRSRKRNGILFINKMMNYESEYI